MKKITRASIALWLSFVIIISCALPVFATDTVSTIQYSDAANSGVRDQLCVSLDGTGAEDYYEEYDPRELVLLTSDELLLSLRSLMTETHTTTTSYDNCRDDADITDCENGDGTSVVLIYTSYRTDMDGYTAKLPGGWNREHVWPQSLGNFGTSEGGADLHHVRPADSSINSSRGNKPYGNATQNNISYSNAVTGRIPGGTYDTTYFEPLDNVKGDVARICLYVYVRWGERYPGYCDQITNAFESIDVLLEWCEMDPVDTWEMGRNEVVENIQGNRNVFIDYPELAWTLFDRDIPADMQTPSGLAGEVASLLCEHKDTELRDVIDAHCTATGYSGDTYCVNCDKFLASGSTTPIAPVHSYGEWIYNTTDTTFYKCCERCSHTENMTYELEGVSAEYSSETILLLLVLGTIDGALCETLNK